MGQSLLWDRDKLNAGNTHVLLKFTAAAAVRVTRLNFTCLSQRFEYDSTDSNSALLRQQQPILTVLE